MSRWCVFLRVQLTIDFLRRVKENAEKRRVAKENGSIKLLMMSLTVETIHLKRQPVMPREARLVKPAEAVETLHPIPYDTRI
jgi:large subunit ribosomal protein L21e